MMMMMEPVQGPRFCKTLPVVRLWQRSLLQHSHFKDCPVFSFPRGKSLLS